MNAFSAQLSAKAAAALAQRADVQSVQPVSIVRMSLDSSVPFIGADQVWEDFGVRGQGMRVAIVDTGIDYTHASFGGEGTVEAYEANDPTFIEPDSFPTDKVIGGFDFVGNDYDVLDADPSNDVPHPDFDPLDSDGHGTHTGSTVAGINVPGEVGRGVAPKALLYAYKVWDEGNSTDDVLVAAYERAMDPNQDGSIADAVDVLSFSGGVDYGTLNSMEAMAAQRVVDLGTVFVASAGNSGNQPSGGSAYISGTPSIARGVVGVAASIDQFLGARPRRQQPTGHRAPARRAHGASVVVGTDPGRGLHRRPVRRSRGRPEHGAALLQPAAGRLAHRADRRGLPELLRGVHEDVQRAGGRGDRRRGPQQRGRRAGRAGHER